MRVKAGVLGHFGEGKNLLNGQTIKTKIVTEELRRALGDESVLSFDTHGGWKTLVKSPFQAFFALKNAKNVVMLPAHNGLRVFGRLLPLLRRFFKNRKIHYVVIGGWVSDFLDSKKGLEKALRKFDGIYVETNTMKVALENRGFENAFVMPNCKKLQILSKEELVYHTEEPYRLCTFSRVMEEKGIADAIEAVKRVNEQFGRTVYTLDIYGQVDGAQVEWFEELQTSFPSYVSYGGLVPFDQSVDVLKNYFALLFPTRFYTEGVPGTIIDAYAAGVPVISAKWQSFFDIVAENVTGYGYEFGSTDDLTDKLLSAIQNTEAFNAMKENCMVYSQRFLPKEAVSILIDNFD